MTIEKSTENAAHELRNVRLRGSCFSGIGLNALSSKDLPRAAPDTPQKQAGRAYRLVDIVLPAADEPINAQTFHWRINRTKYRRVYRREGRCAGGLTPRSVVEQLKAIQMIDVQIPTVDGRWLKMSRFTKPDKAQQLLLAQLQLVLSPQPPPEISKRQLEYACGEDL